MVSLIAGRFARGPGPQSARGAKGEAAHRAGAPMPLRMGFTELAFPGDARFADERDKVAAGRVTAATATLVLYS